jgi:peptidoglycan/LPS O-acetylase OafA/YrhL
MDASRNRGFRGDIEGLRGVAVLLVVLDHLKVPGFRAGFVGVDVFFVISGYLITSLLAREYALGADAAGGRGAVSLRAFYGRRARRILPAALTVIGAGVLAGELLNALRAAQIRHDAAWAVLFAANVHTMRETTNYFSQSLVASSPFQHYWSLAVEEQFYVVWPALFVLAARLTLFGPAAHWRGRVATTACAVGAGSLAWSAVATARAPAPAYFSTFTRAWELALGALIGITASPQTRLPRPAARAASAAGGALLVVSCVVVKGGTPYPGVVALVPTAATALLILGGLTERPPRPNRALALRPLRFVGRISYSVYLWHWPLIVFAAALYPTLAATVQARLLILTLTFAVATLSFYLVEQPGRRIGRGGRAHRRRQRWNLAAAVLGACVLVGAFVGLAAAGREGPAFVPVTRTSTPVGRSSAVVVWARRETPRQSIYKRAVGKWQRVIRDGLRLTTLPPNLRPLLPHLEMGSPPPCIRALPGVSQDECVVGNPAADRIAVLDGDSHAEMLRNAVWRAFDPRTWSIHIFARDACGWAGAAENSASTASECARLQAESLRRIRVLRPNVLLLSEHLVVQPYRSTADIARSLAALTRPAETSIVLGHTPLPQPWSTCLVGDDISRCFTVLDVAFRADRAVEQRLATRAGALFVDTSAWVCVRAGARTVCPPVIDGVPAYKDTTHIGPEYQFKLIPIVRALLVSAGLEVGRARA